jgi:hypothetical protein
MNSDWEGNSPGLIQALYQDLPGVTEERDESRSHSLVAVNMTADNARSVTLCCPLLTRRAEDRELE